jgi:REP element-mobilizing transposase RayT
MPHSYNKIWIHAVWSTKERLPLIHSAIENKIHEYLKSQFIEMGCPVRIINGMSDHIHCLFLLNPQKPVTEVIKQVKGSSSHFINSSNFTEQKFAWQTGYAAFSVSESVMEKVFNYIKNQKEHHAKKTFQHEFDEFLNLHQIKITGNG